MIRKSAIAGTWYPGTAAVLKAEIENYLKNASGPSIKGRITALVSPHAGYMYSGQIAAYGYRLLQGGPFTKAIVIGPSHRAYFQGASIFRNGGFETPLGVVPVDEALAESILGSSPKIKELPEAHAQEHSIEIQMPFLQVVIPGLSFVPVLMGDQSFKTCESVAAAITGAMDDSTVVVASSDLSHFHSYDSAREKDMVVLKRIEQMDAEGMMADIGSKKAEACGAGPIATAMLVSRAMQAGHSEILKYANSGDVTGDRSRVVGYASAVFVRD